jgi:hypothetical protein
MPLQVINLLTKGSYKVIPVVKVLVIYIMTTNLMNFMTFFIIIRNCLRVFMLMEIINAPSVNIWNFFINFR